MQFDPKEILSLASLAIAVGSVIFSWLTSGSKKAQADLDEHKAEMAERHATMDTALDGLDRRVQSLESDFKHLPDKEMVHNLQLTMKDLQLEIGSVKSTSEQAARTAQRVEDFLRSQSKAA